MTLGIRPFTHGLHDVGAGCYAWIQPDGGWGWSNAGLVVDGDESLLVDTLFDLELTRAMLAGMRDAEPSATQAFNKLVNTHANADHCNGNELVAEAEIIASKATADELAAESPDRLAMLMRQAPNMGETGEFLIEAFSAFDFEGITQTLPTTTFESDFETRVGDKRVVLKQVGPCHTTGDILAHVPDEALIFTGDILFIEGHPILWVGPGRELDRRLRLHARSAGRRRCTRARPDYRQARRTGHARLPSGATPRQVAAAADGHET